jgi:putative molybdopterin biosynthesis protein
MRRVALSYTFAGDNSAAPNARSGALQHPLPALLDAVHDTGSISGAARRLGLSYRHVWGELKRWEAEFGQPLVTWVRGQPARLAPAGMRLLHAERMAQARLAPQLDAVRHGIAQAWHAAFGAPLPTLTVAAGHDPLLLLLRDTARDSASCELQVSAADGCAAMASLHDGRCTLAWLQTLQDAAADGPTARALRPLLQAGAHQFVGVATRTLGLMVAPGNPLQIAAPSDLARGKLRFAGRERGSAARLATDEWLAAQGIDSTAVHGAAATEPTQQAVAEAVACAAADAGLGDAALADERGLGFVPLAQELCVLVVPAAALAQADVGALLAWLRSPTWRVAAQAVAGVQAWRSGEVLQAAQCLPWWGTPPRGRGDRDKRP